MEIREAYIRLAEALIVSLVIGVFVWSGDIFLEQAADARAARGAQSRNQLMAQSDQVLGKLADIHTDLSHTKVCGNP